MSKFIAAAAARLSNVCAQGPKVVNLSKLELVTPQWFKTILFSTSENFTILKIKNVKLTLKWTKLNKKDKIDNMDKVDKKWTIWTKLNNVDKLR